MYLKRMTQECVCLSSPKRRITAGVSRREARPNRGVEYQVAREAVGCTPLLALFNSLKPAFCVSIHKTPRVTPSRLHFDGVNRELYILLNSLG